MPVSPSRQQETNHGPGQRKDFKEKTMDCSKPDRNQHDAQNSPIKSVHAFRKCLLSRQLASRQNPVCLDVLFAGLLSNIIGQGRRRWLLVPPDCL